MVKAKRLHVRQHVISEGLGWTALLSSLALSPIMAESKEAADLINLHTSQLFIDPIFNALPSFITEEDSDINEHMTYFECSKLGLHCFHSGLLNS